MRAEEVRPVHTCHVHTYSLLTCFVGARRRARRAEGQACASECARFHVRPYTRVQEHLGGGRSGR